MEVEIKDWWVVPQRRPYRLEQRLLVCALYSSFGRWYEGLHDNIGVVPYGMVKDNKDIRSPVAPNIGGLKGMVELEENGPKNVGNPRKFQKFFLKPLFVVQDCSSSINARKKSRDVKTCQRLHWSPRRFRYFWRGYLCSTLDDSKPVLIVYSFWKLQHGIN